MTQEKHTDVIEIIIPSDSSKDAFLSLTDRQKHSEDIDLPLLNRADYSQTVDNEILKIGTKRRRSKLDDAKLQIRSFIQSHQGLITELIVFLGLYSSYECGYWLAGKTGSREIAMENAHRLVVFEQYTGLYIERPLQQLFLAFASVRVIKAVNSFYMFAHIPCSVAFFIWAYRYHRNRYYELRNAFFVSHLLTVCVEVLYPCAPPRMLPDLGFVDTIYVYTKTHLLTLEQATGINPYAAMPSMHFSYAAAVGGWGYTLASYPIFKNLFLCYTLAVFTTIVITANHFVMDCIVAGALLLIGHSVVWYFPSYTNSVNSNKKTTRFIWIVFYVMLGIGAVIRFGVIRRPI